MSTLPKLYPLQFQPIIKDKIWGGTLLANKFGRLGTGTNLGESWDISAFGEDVSVVINGALAGKDLNYLIQTYQAKLLGKKVWNKYQTNFPLLVKLIDANDKLSVQVHPDDEMAQREHNEPFGKNELWYIMDATDSAELIIGFNQPLTKQKYKQMIAENTSVSALQRVPSKKGDLFPIPAGRLHAIGAGNLILEIQQSSDTTYRFYDWDRLDDNGKPRELHVDLALQAVDMDPITEPKTNYQLTPNQATSVFTNPYFQTNMISLTKPINRQPKSLDSFIIYTCVEGQVQINDQETTITLKTGDSCLIPANITKITLTPHHSKSAKLLEVYI